MSLAVTITVPVMFRLGIGKPAATLEMHDFLHARKWAWISQIL